MFQGFTDDTIDFLWGVRFNNNREWMAEHKQEYQQALMTPLKELAQEVHAALCKKFPDEHLCLHIARIYRDARRMHGKPPLKEEVWFSIYGGVECRTEGPEYYFAVSPDGYSFGLGIWNVRPAAMARYRAQVLADPRRMTALAQAFQRQQVFALCGNDYARSKGEVAPLLQPWFQKRTLHLSCERPYDKVVFSRKLVQQLVEEFSFLMPYYQYFCGFCREEEQ